MTDLMERLTRANPRPSGEAITEEEQREADGLLARVVTEPLPARTPRRPLRTRRIALVGALTAALVGAVLIAVDLFDDGAESGGIVARAAAAVSDRNAIYAITERDSVGGGERAFRRTWLWVGGRQSRSVEYALRRNGSPGRPRLELTSDGHRVLFWSAAINTIATLPTKQQRTIPDPASELRGLVARGHLRAAGRTTVRGRPAYRLESGVHQGVRTTYFVDVRTYLPIAMHTRVRNPHQRIDGRIDYLRYVKLPVTAATKTLLRMTPHPGARHEQTG
jgi:hypothetical protein